MTKSSYTMAFKEQAIEKVLQRGDKTVQCIADELNMNFYTLKNWLKKSTMNSTTAHSKSKRPADCTTSQRFDLLVQSAALEGEALHAFCRQQGVFPHHLKAWKAAFMNAPDSTPAPL